MITVQKNIKKFSAPPEIRYDHQTTIDLLLPFKVKEVHIITQEGFVYVVVCCEHSVRTAPHFMFREKILYNS